MNECLENNGGCWQDKTANLTACRDTYRGRVCECLLVDGVQFKGDGYSHCEGENQDLFARIKCSFALMSSCYSTRPGWIWVCVVWNYLCRQRNFPWGLYSMLPAVRSTSGDSGGNPPHEQFRILHCWVCCHDMFEAKQPREDAC
ncbi:hypothetical protein Goklo_029515 [Gossypium klotzschianum]|uniref:EGF-like calcium-binding domain-containing protein n=1 Tax=Gossypium klotzschianum TaxID=34286 RepID=A0A7J8W9Z6_9ROSI|nr:hypothetical protein [Gossypium klotzschianum]